MHLDHVIQLAIINKLAQSEQPLSYTILKSSDMENSLFSYHLNKLIRRQLVAKSADGYIVTTQGARWLNDHGITQHLGDVPRIFVALVIHNANNEYLIGERTGQFMLAINDYMLPSYKYTNEHNLSEQIAHAVQAFIPPGCVGKQENYGFVHANVRYEDAVTLRVLFSVTLCQTTAFEPLQPRTNINYSWLSLQQIEEIRHPSAPTLRQIISHTRNHKNQYNTPIITN